MIPAYWKMHYQHDRRKHRHRCRHCHKIVQTGEVVFMAKVSGKKTKVLHEYCATMTVPGETEFSELQLLEAHGMAYLAKRGHGAAKAWLEAAPICQTRPSAPMDGRRCDHE